VRKPHFLFLALFIASLASTAQAVPPESDLKGEDRDNSKLAVFIEPGISFLGFGDREKFQDAIDTIYKEYKTEALTSSESTYVAKQDFQKVNFCFPVSAGIQWQWREDNFITAGAGYLYDNESIVLTDRKDKIHNYSYTLQAFPAFLEYRLAISKKLISLAGQSLFSVALRWYWLLPGTEIYSSWGHIKGNVSPLGNGFGFNLGYLITTWKNINIYGDIGYTKLTVKSNDPFSKVVPDTSSSKAKWDLGGLQLQIRFSLGVINKKISEPETQAPAIQKEVDSIPAQEVSRQADSLDSLPPPPPPPAPEGKE